MCISTYKNLRFSNHISTVAQQINICLLYFKKHDHISKPILFYLKVFVLVESWLHMHPHMVKYSVNNVYAKIKRSMYLYLVARQVSLHKFLGPIALKITL
jgi:hypothetical protein